MVKCDTLYNLVPDFSSSRYITCSIEHMLKAIYPGGYWTKTFSTFLNLTQNQEEPTPQEVTLKPEPSPATQPLQPPKEEVEKECEEEGEILSVSSHSPAAKPVGKCYMDIEEEEGGDRRKETSRKESHRTDR